MPTLFRLLSFIAVVVGVAYGAMFAVVTFLKPQPREIMQAINLPRDTAAAGGLTMGRSAAETLTQQASVLVRHPHRRGGRTHENARMERSGRRD